MKKCIKCEALKKNKIGKFCGPCSDIKRDNKKKPVGLLNMRRKAWKAFSKYIRTKGMDEDGLVICYTCGKRVNYKKANAGHGIPGRNNAVLFDERIVRIQCVGCNIYGHGQYQIFTMKLINELGMKIYEQISLSSNRTVKYTIDDYIKIMNDYKAKLPIDK